jgi:hypothetical protein
MYLLGTAQNLCAQRLVKAVEVLLDIIRGIVKRDCLIAEDSAFNAFSCSDHVTALFKSTTAISDSFDQVDRDARRAVADLAKCNMRAPANYCELGRFYSSRSLHIPELDMIFTHALFQSRPS